MRATVSPKSQLTTKISVGVVTLLSPGARLKKKKAGRNHKMEQRHQLLSKLGRTQFEV